MTAGSQANQCPSHCPLSCVVVARRFIDQNELISTEILANECLECIAMVLIALECNAAEGGQR
ncbi:hypothetical protein PAXRUDRAFT_835602 [Paxillus rubicundulus Ve08.2h10]|uniref:Uncharacterized protein n=1 Tax=Paxillus rubicundulus Ve08.2h10 TaxID=930991 RepID=A0A0D0DDT6_9AGAM|nr:hypothetical protein PAXRUDRAFT_835602 [Paxillus rubicundulus Ve08.2h10]